MNIFILTQIFCHLQNDVENTSQQPLQLKCVLILPSILTLDFATCSFVVVGGVLKRGGGCLS